jgi:hypothetical protein
MTTGRINQVTTFRNAPPTPIKARALRHQRTGLFVLSDYTTFPRQEFVDEAVDLGCIFPYATDSRLPPKRTNRPDDTRSDILDSRSHKLQTRSLRPEDVDHGLR